MPRRPPSRPHRRLRARPSRPLRWLGVACLVVIALLYYRPVRSYLSARHTLAARKAEVEALAAQKRMLEERLAATTSGATLVQTARRLGLVKPGERLFIVKDIPAWRHAHVAARGH